MMETSDADQALLQRLHKLTIARNEEGLDGSCQQQLETLVLEDERARMLYAEYMLQTASLRQWATASETPTVVCDEPSASDMEIADESKLRRVWLAFYDVASNYVALSMLVSAIVMAIIVLSMGLIKPELKRDGQPSVPTSIEFVAQITGTEKVTFNKASDGNLRNRSLLAGDKLIVKRGQVEITFADGAIVVLEGPTTFQASSANIGHLQVGKLAANVPKKAIGFTVGTPFANIVDLGTEFGIEVKETGTSEILVVNGKVRVVGTAGMILNERVQLLANKGAIVEAEGSAITLLNNIDPLRLAAIRKWNDAGTSSALPEEIDHQDQAAMSAFGLSAVSANVRLLEAPPSSVIVNALEDDKRPVIFAERKAVVLDKQLKVCADRSGQWHGKQGSALAREAGRLAKGTVVDSYLIHFDPIGDTVPHHNIDTSITFARPIVGVIFQVKRLIETDEIFSSPSTATDTFANRGLDPTDILTISPDLRTVQLHLEAYRPDQVRVLVQAAGEEQP